MGINGIGVDTIEMEHGIGNATGALETVEIEIPKQEYKTNQLETFKELHQSLYILTQEVKEVIRYDLEKIFGIGMDMQINDMMFSEKFRNWDGRNGSE